MFSYLTLNKSNRFEFVQFLDEMVDYYNVPSYMDFDPIQVPHRFTKKQDIEIIGFWIAMIAWGQRKTIIKNGLLLSQLMDDEPYDFMKNHSEVERSRFEKFVHRTFQATDAIYFIDFFQRYYQENDSLEDAFARFLPSDAPDVTAALHGFHHLFFDSPNVMRRTMKHVPTPLRGSTCKRLNMFLRWMVRKDEKGVDFGIWNKIQPHQLMIPLDVHVDRVGRQLGLINRSKTDWKTVVELTSMLRTFDAVDPAKYDFALFGLGLDQAKFKIPKG
ncbi:MAG: TIGR02757 family protein [Saprospiraceae bacterium]|nr:TIGR02757 family protein [Saprospiraceae bacterium]